MTTQDPARDFLDACADIEKELHKRHKMSPETRTLGSVIREAKKRDAVVRRYWDELRAFTELRNAISHNRYQDGSPIATPLPETVEAIQRIRDQILKPRDVGSVVSGRTYYSVRRSDPLQPHLREMTRQAFAQAPVESELEEGHPSRKTLQMLTTNAIARWVGESMDENGDVILEGATVESALVYAENHEIAVLVPRKMTVAQACEKLLSPSAPIALIVTETGSAEQTPLGLLTASDLTELFGILGSASN